MQPRARGAPRHQPVPLAAGLQAGGQGSWQSIMPFAWSNGAELTKDDGKAYNFDSPEVLKAAEYYQSFFTEGIADKAAPATPTTEPDFASGKVPINSKILVPWARVR